MATNFYTELNLNGNDLKGLPASPTDATSATSKAYVDSVASGLDVKGSVKTASTAAVTLSGVGANVGGVTVAADDRVLVKDQTPASDNGIYVVKVGAWVRASDALVGSTLNLGAFTFVEGGTNKGKGYVYSDVNTWTQFSDTGSLGAGNGLDISGSNFVVKPKSGGNIAVDGDGVAVTGTLGVAIGGTGAATFTAGFLKSTGGTTAFTTVAGIGIDEVTGRRLTGNYTAAFGTHAETIDTTSLNSALRTFASVAVFDSSNNQVFADVQVNSGNVKITTTHNVAGGIALKYLITV
jgi:hypothetical protein